MGDSVRNSRIGGWGEIRTHGMLSHSAVFKTAALNHSATHPSSFIKLREEFCLKKLKSAKIKTAQVILRKVNCKIENFYLRDNLDKIKKIIF